jgi:WD40 repeat protein
MTRLIPIDLTLDPSGLYCIIASH